VTPEDAVQHGPRGLLAYVIGRDDRVSPRPIEVSHTGNGEAVVTKGLSPGEKIVVEGQYRLQPGSKVQASPMASPVEVEKLAQADR
jgi:multidrug efflux system membrane fusion protein